MRTPKHGLTRTARGWLKRINGKPKWIVSDKLAPTPAAADAYYEQHFAKLWKEPVAPPATEATITVKYLADTFYDRKQRAGLDPRTLADYDAALLSFVRTVGGQRHPDDLLPADFATVRAAWSGRFGPDRLGKFITAIRGMFAWASKPPLRLREPDYGDEFKVPSKAEFRRHRKHQRETHGRKLFEPVEVQKLLAAAKPMMRAMILLALNGGFGNTDVADLPCAVVDVGGQFLDYARGKTGIERRVPLWPATLAAVKAAIALSAKRLQKRRVDGRPVEPAAERLVFVTRQGRPYVLDKTSAAGSLLHKDSVSTAFAKLAKPLGLARHGRNFYSLRRTFRTYADEVGDARAVDLIMGHATTDMGGTYVLAVADQRLLKVVNHVRTRLGISTDSEPLAAAKRRGGGGAKVKAAPSRHRKGKPRRRRG